MANQNRPYWVYVPQVPGPQGPQGAAGADGVGIQGATGPAGASAPKLVYRLTTNASGVASVVYPTPFFVLPNIQAQIIGGLPSQRVLVTANSLTGLTVTVYQTNAVSLLGIDVLLAATVLVNAAVVDVAVF